MKKVFAITVTSTLLSCSVSSESKEAPPPAPAGITGVVTTTAPDTDGLLRDGPTAPPVTASDSSATSPVGSGTSGTGGAIAANTPASTITGAAAGVSATGSPFETVIFPTDPTKATITGVGPKGENPRSCLMATNDDAIVLDCLGQKPIFLEQPQVPQGTSVPPVGVKTWTAGLDVCPGTGTGIAQWEDANVNKVYDIGEKSYSVVNVCKPQRPVSLNCEVTNPSADNVMITCPNETRIISTGSTITVCMHDRLPDRYTWTWSVEEFLSTIMDKKIFLFGECMW